MTKKYFKTLKDQKIPLPVFFPDATRAVIRSIDSVDIKNSNTKGILVNTFHLSQSPGKSTIDMFKGVGPYMHWNGAIISDSGGFQVMSIAKRDGSKNSVTDKGVRFKLNGKKKILFTPEDSIVMQSKIRPDMIVVLDDFTPPNANFEEASETVRRTILWAKQCKAKYLEIYQNVKKKPYLLAVSQGGSFPELRKHCTQELVKIGFDGIGYGGWPIKENGEFDYNSAKIIKENTPENYFLYGLGIGKPHEVVKLSKSGWNIFDCVLPTRDARHKRLYVYNAESVDTIDINSENFYSYYTPDKEVHYRSEEPVSKACDCQLCTNYSRAYLHHLFKIGDMTAGRLATIHNLRFYSILMEKLANELK